MHGILDPRNHLQTCTGPPSHTQANSRRSDSESLPADSDTDSSVELFNDRESTWMAELPAGIDANNASDSDGSDLGGLDGDDGSGSGSEGNAGSDINSHDSADNAPEWELAQRSESGESDFDIDFDEPPNESSDEPDAVAFDDFCEANEGQVRLLQWIRKNKIAR